MNNQNMLAAEETINCGGETGIHQKRTLAFINHFIMKSVEFMNNFALQCENKLIDYEAKMQKVKASLAILESKLASIPSLTEQTVPSETVNEHAKEPTKPDTLDMEISDLSEPLTAIQQSTESTVTTRDPRLDRYYKMMQVGVPIQAVKLKMIQEGMDPEAIN